MSNSSISWIDLGPVLLPFKCASQFYNVKKKTLLKIKTALGEICSIIIAKVQYLLFSLFYI